MHEQLLVLLLAAGYILELLVIKYFWSQRKPIAMLTIITIAASALYILLFAQALGPVILVFAFRVINMLRVIKERSNQEYLKQAVWRSSYRLLLFVAIIIAFINLVQHFQISARDILLFVAIFQVAVAFCLLLITGKNVIKTKQLETSSYLSDNDLPTISVAIPARNESAYLGDCLELILANNYPKMEIIVLDDCSHDNTAEVIKNFAHRGVRFIQGEQPDTRWLPKNWAYQRLLEESSGELVLFCGVDVRFDAAAIRKLVTVLLKRNKSMISILPVRTTASLRDGIIQPMRYWWEISLPRKLFNRPAAISTCWLIKRNALLELGGFKAVSRSIIPERFFARETVKTDSYSFIRSSSDLGVYSVKGLREQRATAIRQRYPQLRRRPENACLLFCAEFIFLLGPIAGLIIGIIAAHTPLMLLSGVAYLLLLLTHIMVVAVTHPPNSLMAVFNYPITALTEMVVSLESMLLYEFSEVSWKGRDVCLPAMRAVPRLPRL